MDGNTEKKLTIRFFLLIFVTTIIYPESCFAWGAGIHIADGLFVLGHLASINPVIASSISAHPYDYLYGCISADIFIGKGYKRRDDHCHNWSVALNMLSKAETKSENAFMFGYLSHLATDVIAHNYFVPNQLYITPTSRRIGHAYWEVRSDEFMEQEIWGVAIGVIEKHNKKNDRFMRKAIKKASFPFFARKRVYYRSIRIHNVKLWRKAFSAISNHSKWEIDREYILYLNLLSLNLVMDFLKNPKEAVCLKYDPVGTDNMISAKRERRREKRNMGGMPVKKIFHPPREIKELNIVDPKIQQGLDIRQLLSHLHALRDGS